MNTLKKLHKPNAIATTAATYLAVIAAIAVVAVTTSTPLGSARAAGGLKDKHGAQLAELYELQAAFHAAASHGGDIDAMMQLWADDSSITVVGVLYSGKDGVRDFFANHSGAFKHDWVSLAPAPKTLFDVQAGSWVLGNAKQDHTSRNIEAGVMFRYAPAVGAYRCPADKSTVKGDMSLRRTRSYTMNGWLNSSQDDQGANGLNVGYLLTDFASMPHKMSEIRPLAESFETFVPESRLALFMEHPLQIGNPCFLRAVEGVHPLLNRLVRAVVPQPRPSELSIKLASWPRASGISAAF